MEKEEVINSELYKSSAHYLPAAEKKLLLAALQMLCGTRASVRWHMSDVNEGITWATTPQGSDFWEKWDSHIRKCRAAYNGEEDDEEDE